MKTNFTDLTFLIPVRLDSIERLENIISVIEFLSENFQTNIEVLESSSFENGILRKLLSKEISYCFMEDNDPILFRTKIINHMVTKVTTPYVSVWDTDVIAPARQIIDSLNLLRSDKADFVYPYESYFLDTTYIIRKLYMKEKRVEFLEINTKKMTEMYPPHPVGGAFLAKTSCYIEAGIENERFYGWGLEDSERCSRWIKLGYKIKRVPGPLFHLSHSRGKNSTFHNPDQRVFKLKNSVANYLKQDINLNAL